MKQYAAQSIAKRRRRKQLGNPLAVAAAAKALSDKEVRSDIAKGTTVVVQRARRTISNIGIAVAVVATIIAVKKAIKAGKRERILNQAAADPNVRAAVLLYSEIPDRYLPHGTLLNPFNLIETAWDNISVWDSANQSRIMSIGDSITNWSVVQKTFKDAFGVSNLVEILSAVLSPENLDKFLSKAARDPDGDGNVSTTAVTNAYKWAVVKATSGVNVRTSPQVAGLTNNPNDPTNNVKALVPYGKILGWTTGNEVYDKKSDIVFTEFKYYVEGESAATRSAYVWKGALVFLDNNGLMARYNNTNRQAIYKAHLYRFAR